MIQSRFFLLRDNNFIHGALSDLKGSYRDLKGSCDVTWTEAPPTIVDWQLHFSTDCTGQHSDLPWVSCHQLFHHRSRSRQEWLLSDWGVLLLDVIMNIAVVIYSQYGLLWKELFLTDKKVFFTPPMKKFNQMVKCIQTHFVSVFF